MQFSVRPSGASSDKNMKVTFPTGTTRSSAKAYKNFMIEAGLLDDEETEEIRQCFGPGCVLPAKPGSKYCSEDCGLKLNQA